MTRQQKIKAFERRGYAVYINYNALGTQTVCIKLPWGSWRFYKSVNEAYKHRPWK